MKVSNRLLIIAAIFTTCLITANIIAVKVVSFGPVQLPAAVVVFPLSYIFGDVLTEVYGFRTARRVIWLGFGCNLLFVFFAWIGQLLPPASAWGSQAAYESILGAAPRVLAASAAGYLAGEFSNSIVLARMKVLTRGRWLWMRTIGSTIVGEGLDSAIFLTVAYLGMPFFTPWMILYHWAAKTAIEAAATPLTYRAVNYLKRKDAVDVFDDHTNLNPFSVSD
jgi:queuosine precursor transporter